jgi:hypothetical protein
MAAQDFFDGLDETRGLDRSSGPGHAKGEETSRLFYRTMAVQDLMVWIGMVAQIM